MNAPTKHKNLFRTLLVLGVLVLSTLIGRSISSLSQTDAPELGVNTAQVTGLDDNRLQYANAPGMQPVVAGYPQSLNLAQPSTQFQGIPSNQNERSPTFQNPVWTPPQTSLPDQSAGTANSLNSPRTYGYYSSPDDTTYSLNGPGSHRYYSAPGGNQFKVVHRSVPDPDNPGQFKTTTEYVAVPQANNYGDPADAQSNRVVQQLLQQLRAASPEQRDKLKLAELRTELEKQFQARHAAQQQRLEKVLADATQMQELLARRTEQRDEIIDRRLAELLGQADPMSWDYPLQATPAHQSSSGNWNQTGFTTEAYAPKPRMSRINPTPAHGQAGFPTVNPNALPFEEVQSRLREIQQASERKALEAMQDESQQTLEVVKLAGEAIEAADRVAREKIKVENELSSQTLEPVNTAPVIAASPSESTGIVGLGYRLLGLKKQLELAEVKFNMGQMGQSEFAKLKNDVLAAEAAWQYNHRELERDLAFKKLAIEKEQVAQQMAATESEEGNRLYKQGSLTYSSARELQLKSQVTEIELKRAVLELDAVQQSLDWTKNFEKQLESSKESTTSDENSSETPATDVPELDPLNFDVKEKADGDSAN